MIELLLVIAILGAIIAVISPIVGAGMAGTETATASRSLVQAARYARTMALLHQAETEIWLTSAKDETSMGIIEVKAVAPSGYGSYSGAIDFENTSSSAFLSVDSDDSAQNVSTNVTAGDATAATFAEEINSKFECRGISFVFEGYNDTLDNTGKNSNVTTPEESENEVIKLKFKSNGQCRPFSVRVCSGEEFSHMVSVDMIGKGKIEGYGDED